MKYIKNLILTVSGIAVAMGVSSCNSFLDMTPTDSVSDKMLWKTSANAEYGVNYTSIATSWTWPTPTPDSVWPA